MAPRQAGFEVLSGSKEGAKIVVKEAGYFLAGDNEEVDEVVRTSLSEISWPEPGVAEPTAVNEVGTQKPSPHAGFKCGVPMLNFMHGGFHTW